MIARPLTKEEHYHQLAIDFKGQAKLRRCDAAVHVEAAQDQHFWNTIFHHFAPHRKFHFIAHSRTWRGTQASGVTQCLSFKPFLSKDFFICIDSDYRYLLQEEEIKIDHFIFQTYTYSIENHYCAAEGLNYVCKLASGETNEIFDFERFLKHYSEIVYELFLWHIYTRSNSDVNFGRSEFYQLIGLRRYGVYPDIANDGEQELANLNIRVREKLDWLNRNYPQTNLQPIRERLEGLGVKPDNVYLFLRGHNLFDSVVAVGRKVCAKLLEKKKVQNNAEKLQIATIYSNGHDFESYVKHNFSFGRYEEINKIGKDIDAFFNEPATGL